MNECNHAVVGSCEKCKPCGVCGRPKGDPHRYPVAGECTAPDSTDYTVSLMCMSIALRKAQDDVKAAEERGQAKERMLRDGAGGEKDLNLETYAAAIRAGDDPGAVMRYVAAAAEERGRRSGAEEADGTVRSAVRLALACAAEIADSIDNIVTRRVIARRIRALIPPPQGNTVWPDPAHDGVVERLRVAIDAALAPRDSAPARYCDEPHPSQPLKCGRFVQHDGPHTAFVPGYEFEQRAAVHWAPRDSGKEGQR